MVRELGTRPFTRIVVQDLDTGVVQFSIDLRTRRIGFLIARLQVDQSGFEGRDGYRPNNTLVVVTGLDDRACKARNSDAIRPHLNVGHFPIRRLHATTHGFRVLRAEEENMTDLDAPRRDPLVRRHFLFEALLVMHIVGRGIEATSTALRSA